MFKLYPLDRVHWGVAESTLRAQVWRFVLWLCCFHRLLRSRIKSVCLKYIIEAAVDLLLFGESSDICLLTISYNPFAWHEQVSSVMALGCAVCVWRTMGVAEHPNERLPWRSLAVPLRLSLSQWDVVSNLLWFQGCGLKISKTTQWDWFTWSELVWLSHI